MWFQYRDQPLTGRGPGHGRALTYGEHFAFGLMTMTDRVKWPLFERMRQANLAAARVRAAAMSTGKDPAGALLPPAGSAAGN